MVVWWFSCGFVLVFFPNLVWNKRNQSIFLLESLDKLLQFCKNYYGLKNVWKHSMSIYISHLTWGRKLSQNDFTSITVYWDIVASKRSAHKKWASCCNKILSFLIGILQWTTKVKFWGFFSVEGLISVMKLCNQFLDGVIKHQKKNPEEKYAKLTSKVWLNMGNAGVSLHQTFLIFVLKYCTSFSV